MAIAVPRRSVVVCSCGDRERQGRGRASPRTRTRRRSRSPRGGERSSRASRGSSIGARRVDLQSRAVGIHGRRTIGEGRWAHHARRPRRGRAALRGAREAASCPLGRRTRGGAVAPGEPGESERWARGASRARSCDRRRRAGTCPWRVSRPPGTSAAAANDLGDAPIARTILGTPLVLYRDASGAPGALTRPLSAPQRAALPGRGRRPRPAHLRIPRLGDSIGPARAARCPA